MSSNGFGPIDVTPETPGVSYARNKAIPQCGCQCHNRELANVVAELDVDGHAMPLFDAQEPVFWRSSPRWVDRRDEAEAVLACRACKPLHALAYSSDPAARWAEEQHRMNPAPEHAPRAKLGGPQGQCLPTCPFCKKLDSVTEEHQK